MRKLSSSSSPRSPSNEGSTSGLEKGGKDAAHPPLETRARHQSASADAMAAIFGGTPQDFQVPPKKRDRSRHNSMAGMSTKSRSPSMRLGRAPSPGLSLLNNNKSSPMHIMTDSSDFDVMDGANEREYRTKPSTTKPPDSAKQDSKERDPDRDVEWSNGVRLEKDREAGSAEDEEALESSDDDEARSSDDEDGSRAERKRGRRRKRDGASANILAGESEDSEDDPYSTIYGQNQSTRKAKHGLAAAEEERRSFVFPIFPSRLMFDLGMAQSKAKLRSSEPSDSGTGPGGEKMGSKRGEVHPNTSYDYEASGAHSANSSDADVSDIRRAQKLSINMSHLDMSVPNRVIRTILRGDFATTQEEADDGLKRQRLYLVATDLSDEAVYALEWTIGTILRDGDTLLAIYAVDEETGTGKSVDADPNSSVQVGEVARTVQDTMDAMTSQTERLNRDRQKPALLTPNSYVPATSSGSRPGSVDSRMLSKAELERQRAIEDISSTCVRLLRKTKLQVRVAIEVIHCKSPKYMITEAVRLSPRSAPFVRVFNSHDHADRWLTRFC
jgi:hypothetical protein